MEYHFSGFWKIVLLENTSYAMALQKEYAVALVIVAAFSVECLTQINNSENSKIIEAKFFKFKLISNML